MKKTIRLLLTFFMIIGLFISITLTIDAASYPLPITRLLGTTYTIPSGETGKLSFSVIPKYKNEKLNIEIYNSNDIRIGSSSSSYYNDGSTSIRYLYFTLDTKELGMGVGTYKIKYWSSFYSLYEWHDGPNKYTDYIKVIENKCKGNHNLVLDHEVSSDITCSKAGTVQMRCTKCDYYCYEERTGNHSYGNWSYQDSAVHKKTCSACGNNITESHKWNSGLITKQPTCNSTGIKTYTCTVCGGTKTETLSKNNDHNYSTEVVAPNCVEQGYTLHTCTRCGTKYKDQYTEKSGHTYDKAIRVDSDNHYHKCTVCGNEETVAHTWDKGTIRLKPTLNTTGLCDYVCTDCGATKTEIIPKRSAGDLNGDINVDNKDVEYLLWHTLFPDKYPIDTFADFNSDGTVDNKDVEYLLWHTLFPDKYPIT